MYLNGDDVKADSKQAITWLKVSAQPNNVQAAYHLAAMSERGISVTQNDQKAFQWYLKAAELGHAKAQYKVANAYHIGTGKCLQPNGSINQQLKATLWHKFM